jgi:hypothetical protein
LRLKNLEDQILFAKAAGARNLKGARDAAQFRNVFFFEFCDGHVHLQQRRMGVERSGNGKGSGGKQAGIQGLRRLAPF